MTRLRRDLVGMVVVMLAATSCGGSDGANDDGAGRDGTVEMVTTMPADVDPDADVLSVAELFGRLDTDRDRATVVVATVLFDDGSGLRICEALAESFPPQCPGRSIEVRNPDLIDVELTEEQGVRWTDRRVWLAGWLEDGAFFVT